MEYMNEEDLGKYEKKIVEISQSLEKSFWDKYDHLEANIPDIEIADNVLYEGAKHSLVWMVMHYVLGFEPSKRLEAMEQFMQHVQMNVFLNLDLPVDQEEI
jgi:hypothetical protein